MDARIVRMLQEVRQSPYLAEFRREHAVIPGMCGLPRIIRAFIA